MRRTHPDHRMDIPISMEVWQQLLGASADSNYQKEDWKIAAEAIDEWVRRHTPQSIPTQPARGVQWKSQFLPAGTLLRTVFGGKNYHCLVEGDQILYNGKAVSPSGFVNAVGGMRRNAWRCTWILFPDSKDWKLADTLRTRARPRRARKPAGDVQQAPAPQPVAGRAPVSAPPVADPFAAQIASTAASASEAPDAQHAINDQVPWTDAHRERRNRQQRTGINLSSPRFTYGAGHSIHGDDRITAMLREELLPLLYRMCVFDGMVPPN
jgi:hypothetical protein